jgi:hypothetical protein
VAIVLATDYSQTYQESGVETLTLQALQKLIAQTKTAQLLSIERGWVVA